MCNNFKTEFKSTRKIIYILKVIVIFPCICTRINTSKSYKK